MFIGLYTNSEAVAFIESRLGPADLPSPGSVWYEQRLDHDLLFDLQETEGRLRTTKAGLCAMAQASCPVVAMADRSFPITAIHEENLLQKRMGAWDEVQPDLTQIKMLPPSWIRRLSGYRGIYFIFDRTPERVVEAYGAENILATLVTPWAHAALAGRP